MTNGGSSQPGDDYPPTPDAALDKRYSVSAKLGSGKRRSRG